MLKSKTKFFSFLSIVFIFIFSFGALSVSASGPTIIDYENYIGNLVHEDGMTYADIVTPTSFTSWQVIKPDGNTVSAFGSDKISWYEASYGSTTIVCFLFGASFERTMSLANIPYGTTLAIAPTFYCNGSFSVLPYVSLYIDYYDSSGNVVGTQINNTGRRMKNGEALVINMPFQYPSNAVAFDIHYVFTDYHADAGSETDFWIEDGGFQIFMDQVTWNFLHTPIDSVKPNGDGTLGGLVGDEDQLKDYIQEGFGVFDSIMSDAVSQISAYFSCFAVVSYILTLFIDIPIIYTLLTLSLSLGVFASVLGIVSSFGLSAHRSGTRGKFERKNGG